jgi:adenylate cyclase
MNDAAAAVYEFAGFRLHLRQRLLFSADQRPVALSPRAFEMLVALLERPGKMLDKSELMSRVWPKTVVEENSLNQCISQLRRALGERPGEHRFILTEPGRGYRFVAEVREVSHGAATIETAGAPPESRAPTPGTKRASPSPSAAPTSIAVLPLANLTRDPEKEYFGDGMAEELINMLTRMPGLKVPARTSSFAYKGRNIDVRQIARELDVDALLEGSVRSAGDRIRLTVQLVDGKSGYHLWSQNYDRDFGDLFALQDELAGSIVQAIRDTLNRSVDAVTQGGPPAQDLEAYQLYLRGRALMSRGAEQHIRRAMDLLSQAVARDPTFARAHSAMALAHWVAFFMNYPLTDPLGEAEREAERALAIDPKLAEAHGILGGVYAARLEWLKADASLRTAWALAENDAFTRTQHGLMVGMAAGHFRKAVKEIRAAHQMAPADALVALRLCTVLLMTGAPVAEGMKYATLAIDLGFPKTLSPVPLMYGLAAWREQRYTEAADFLVQELRVPGLGAEHAVRLALSTLATGGETSPAIAALRAVEEKAHSRRLAWDGIGFFCWLYTWLGALDHAYEAAHRTLDEMERSGPVWIFPGGLWAHHMQVFRQDPRFQALVTRLGLMRYWEEYGPPDDCELRGGRLICR